MVEVKIKFLVSGKGQCKLSGFTWSGPRHCLHTEIARPVTGVWQKKIPHLQNRNTSLYFVTFPGSLEQCAPCDSGRVISRCSFGQSVKQGLCTVLLLKLQPSSRCSFGRTNTRAPWDEVLRIKGSRTSPFCFLLSQELVFCYAKDLLALCCWKYGKILGTSNWFSLRVRMLLVRSRKSFFQHPWHDENTPLSPIPLHFPLCLPESSKNNKSASLLSAHGFCLEEDYLQANNRWLPVKKSSVF